MQQISYRQALHESLYDCLKKNEFVFLMGEDVAKYGGTYAVSKNMLEEFGEERIIDTPLSEAGFTGVGIGAAIGGLRPIVEIMTVNFALLALDQIINNAATLNHMSGGQIQIPIIIRISTGATKQLAAQHSHDFSGWFAHIVGLRILSIGTVTDARYMLKTCIQDSIPTIIFEHAALLNEVDELENIEPFEIIKAKVIIKGSDLSIISHGASLRKCIEIANEYKNKGISIEVIDLRSLRPIDEDTIFKSVLKTHKVLVVDEGWKSVGIASEIVARVQENLFYELDKPIRRVCSYEVPIPYNYNLEQQIIPNLERIRIAIEELIQ